MPLTIWSLTAVCFLCLLTIYTQQKKNIAVLQFKEKCRIKQSKGYLTPYFILTEPFLHWQHYTILFPHAD